MVGGNESHAGSEARPNAAGDELTRGGAERKEVTVAAIEEEVAVPAVIHLSDEEGRALFDSEARELLGISGVEFLRRLRAGEYDGVPDDPEHWDILYLAMMGTGGR